jgi:hypothetical protein
MLALAAYHSGALCTLAALIHQQCARAPLASASCPQVVKKGIQSNLLVSYLFHEVDEAEEGVEEKQTNTASGESGLWRWQPVADEAGCWLGIATTLGMCRSSKRVQDLPGVPLPREPPDVARASWLAGLSAL